jgi:hypothetical protein
VGYASEAVSLPNWSATKIQHALASGPRAPNVRRSLMELLNLQRDFAVKDGWLS